MSDDSIVPLCAVKVWGMRMRERIDRSSADALVGIAANGWWVTPKLCSSSSGWKATWCFEWPGDQLTVLTPALEQEWEGESLCSPHHGVWMDKNC